MRAGRARAATNAVSVVFKLCRSPPPAHASTTRPSFLLPLTPFQFSNVRRRRDPYSGGRLQRVRCQLKTTGGNCAQLVQQSLGQLLLRLGLNPYFYFDGDQFRPKSLPRPKPRAVPKPKSSRPAAGGRRGAAAASAAPVGPGTRRCSLRHCTAAARACALVPHPLPAAPMLCLLLQRPRQRRWSAFGPRRRGRGSPARPSASSSLKKWRRSRCAWLRVEAGPLGGAGWHPTVTGTPLGRLQQLSAANPKQPAAPPPNPSHPQAAARGAKADAAAAVDETVDKMKRIDPLLAAVAAVPWLVHTGVSGAGAGRSGACLRLATTHVWAVSMPACL